MQFIQNAAVLFLTVLVSRVRCVPLNVTESLDFDNLAGRAATNCGGNMYSAGTQQDGYGDLVSNLQNGQTYSYTNSRGQVRTYPEVFNNGEDFSTSACKSGSGTFYEQPVFSNGNEYMGGTPGPDRAVVRKNGDGSYTQCWFMTHTGASGNGFVLCT